MSLCIKSIKKLKHSIVCLVKPVPVLSFFIFSKSPLLIVSTLQELGQPQ